MKIEMNLKFDAPEDCDIQEWKQWFIKYSVALSKTFGKGAETAMFVDGKSISEGAVGFCGSGENIEAGWIPY